MSEYNIQMNKYNALSDDYDQLYPQPMKHASTHAKDGSDPILPSSIGAYSKEETNTLLANKADVSSVYTKEESISASTRTALSLAENATPDVALAKIAQQLSEKAPSSIAAYSDIEINVNDGESIQEVINSIPRVLNGHSVRVNVYGSHTESVTINGYSGYPEFYIVFHDGASLTGSILVDGPGRIYLVSFGSVGTITSTGICVTSSEGAMVYCNGVNLITTGAAVVEAYYGSRLAITNCTVKATGSANYQGALLATHCSEITANEVIIDSGTTYGLAAQYTSLIRFKGTNNATNKSTTYSGGQVVTL